MTAEIKAIATAIGDLDDNAAKHKRLVVQFNREACEQHERLTGLLKAALDEMLSGTAYEVVELHIAFKDRLIK